MKVAVIGAGYVGLTTAACFAHLGHDVLCADIDAERVARLQKGEVPILEVGPARAAQRRPRVAAGSGSSSAPPTAARDAEIVFLCVQTPQGDDGSADLSYVETVAREIAPVLARQHGRREQVDGAGRLDALRAARALRERACAPRA